MKKTAVLVLIFLIATVAVQAQPDTLGWRLEHYRYPYPVKYMKATVENIPVEIAYMDEQLRHGTARQYYCFTARISLPHTGATLSVNSRRQDTG